MGEELYSQSLPDFDGELSIELQESLNLLKSHFGIDELKVLEYDESSIAIPLKLKVSLPSRWDETELNIREKEPILITIYHEIYPKIAPKVCSDRIDFPKSKLSHLYASRKGTPAFLCLVKGNIHEWYSNKRLPDILYLAEEWFFKAVTDKLNVDGDRFEPIRMENYSGTSIYKYSTLLEIASKNQRFVPKNGAYAILLQSISQDKHESEHSYKIHGALPFLMLNKLKELIDKWSFNSTKDGSLDKPVWGLLCWSEDDRVEHEYSVELPRSYGELVAFCKGLGINIEESITCIRGLKLQYLNGIPLTIGFKRPLKLIGHEGDYEFISFVISAETENFSGVKIKKEASVSLLAHREPFNAELARRISGASVMDNSIMLIGAGSLGSKIGAHLGRKGVSNLTVVDNEELEPHNLVRHVLLENSVGKNKANELVKIINGFSKLDNVKSIKSIPNNAFSLTQELASQNWIIESTASDNIRNWLCSSGRRNIKGNLCKVEIADNGRLGLLYIEGKDGNPRIDDLIYSLFTFTKISGVKRWLKNEQRKREAEDKDEFVVGLGCNSESMIVSDDQISLHAASFSRVIEKEFERTNIKENGLLFIQELDESFGINISTTNELVKAFVVIGCKNGSGWIIRIKDGIREQLLEAAKNKTPKETGGVFIGISNYKTKTIHILDWINAPPDSREHEMCFIRGTENLPERVDEIKENTGNILGYVGEWHSHPMDLEKLSHTDLEAASKLKSINDQVPIPTLIMIIVNGKLMPFVFQ